MSVPAVLSTDEPTFLVNTKFHLKKIYDSSGMKKLSHDEIEQKDISSTVNKFKLSYHPD